MKRPSAWSQYLHNKEENVSLESCSMEIPCTLWEVKPFQDQEHQENIEKLNKHGN